jgi:L-alanine-DL-glutamate epimerase-like enolase superfamily enzyme
MPTIKRLDTVTLKGPFDDFYRGERGKPRGWTHFDTVLMRIEDQNGVVGWGEAFAYNCAEAVTTAIRTMVCPLMEGKEVGDVAAFTLEVQKKLHIWGRYGITMFAISGLDIALWDLAAKQAGVSLAEHLGGRHRDSLPAYASLVRYAETKPLQAVTALACEEGFADIKLHEPGYDCIEAAREAVGDKIRLTTDVNCGWSVEEAEDILPRLKPLDLFWVEEPIFPPEDYDTLARLGRQFGVPLSAGENACTAVEFARLIEAVAYPQPSVTKVGGVSEFLKVASLAKAAGKTIMPHSPYFGPGYWATLQLCGHLPEAGLFEFLYVEADAWLGRNIPLPKDGQIAIPDGPGIGFEPNEAAIAQFRIN